MESPSTWTIVILIVNILIMIIAFFGGKVINGMQGAIEKADTKTTDSFQRIFDKLEGYQTIKGCVLAHENHDKIHQLEKVNQNEKIEKIENQINNVANIARSKVSRVHTE